MAHHGIKQKNILSTRQIAKQIGGMRLSQLFGLPEHEFARLIKDIENDPLFQKLMYPASYTQKAISYKRFPRTDLSAKFYEFDENMAGDNTSFDIGAFLKKKEEAVSIIGRLGIAQFKQYFLYNENRIPDEELANSCGLTISDVQRIQDVVDDLAIHTQLYHPSTISAVNQLHYLKIASIEKEGPHGFIAGYFSPVSARGKYSINYEKIENMKSEHMFSNKEIHGLNKLLTSLESINKRKTAVSHVIGHIIETQTEYLRTADETKMKFLTQKELANRINVHPSVICRTIKYRSIEMPWGEEKPLKFFFSGKKKEIHISIRVIIAEEKNRLKKGFISRAYSDEKIRDRLEREHKINIARRTVREYRKELEIPAATARVKG